MFDMLQLVVPRSPQSSLKKLCPPMSDMLQLVVHGPTNSPFDDVTVH
jgi:hypothetical protein